jgi:hypothetical protein
LKDHVWFREPLGTKRRINEVVRSCPIDLNGVNTIVDLNIISLGSYDILIGMDWLDKHHVVLDCHNKTFTCLDEEGKQSLVKGIPRPISIREISALQLKRCFRKGCQLFAVHVKEPTKNKSRNLEDLAVLQEFDNVFGEILISISFFVDDMILLASSPEGLQRQLDALALFCNLQQLTFNLGKTKVMIFNRLKKSTSLHFFFRQEKIEITSTYTYLGV